MLKPGCAGSLAGIVSLLDHAMLSPDAKHNIQEHIEAMPDALRHERATEEQLREFEASYGEIPADYRWFLLTCGGGHFGSPPGICE